VHFGPGLDLVEPQTGLQFVVEISISAGNGCPATQGVERGPGLVNQPLDVTAFAGAALASN
jgi:hypothetical protein